MKGEEKGHSWVHSCGRTRSQHLLLLCTKNRGMCMNVEERERRQKGWAKQLLLLGEGIFHPSSAHYQITECLRLEGTCRGHHRCLQNNKELDIMRCFGLWYLRQVPIFPVFKPDLWDTCFSKNQPTIWCRYFSVRKMIHMKSLEHKTLTLPLHLLYRCDY